MNKLQGTVTLNQINSALTNSIGDTITSTDWYWTWPETTPLQTPTWTQTLTSYPMYITPDIKILNVKGKVIFYYWDNQTLNYAIYKESEKMKFKKTSDFLQVLSELGMFE